MSELETVIIICTNAQGKLHFVPKDFKHKIEIQIRFKDLDMMQHVNHADYLSYVELARLKYYDDVLGPDIDWHVQHGLIMARTEVDYKSAIAYDDNVVVYTRCSKLGIKSFELTWLMTKSKNGGEETAAEGKTVIVCYNYELKKSVEIPVDRRLKIQKYEGLKPKVKERKTLKAKLIMYKP